MPSNIPIEDLRELFQTFKVGTLWVIKKDHFYQDKLLKVTAVDMTGVTFEDENEQASNRWESKVKHCFGWPPIQHHLGNDTLRPAPANSSKGVTLG